MRRLSLQWGRPPIMRLRLSHVPGVGPKQNHVDRPGWHIGAMRTRVIHSILANACIGCLLRPLR